MRPCLSSHRRPERQSSATSPPLDGASGTLPRPTSSYATATSPTYANYQASFNDITTIVTTTTGGGRSGNNNGPGGDFGGPGHGGGWGGYGGHGHFFTSHSSVTTTTTVTGTGYDTTTGLGTPKAGAVVASLLVATTSNSALPAGTIKAAVKPAAKVASSKNGRRLTNLTKCRDAKDTAIPDRFGYDDYFDRVGWALRRRRRRLFDHAARRCNWGLVVMICRVLQRPLRHLWLR